MNWKKYLHKLLLSGIYLLGILGIVASGGGGSGGGDDGLEYVGSKSPATITETNAARLAANTFGFQGLIDLTTDPLARPSNSAISNPDSIRLLTYGTRLSQMLRNQAIGALNKVSRSLEVRTRTEVDETESCDSGSLRITGFINDDGTGSLTLDFKNCRFGSDTLDGKIRLKVKEFDFGLFIPVDLKITIKKLKIKTPDVNVTIEGSLLSKIIGNDELLVIPELIAKNNTSDEMLMIRNQTSTSSFDNIFFPASVSITISSGRIFDSEFGYVDFRTLRPLIYSDISQLFPDDGNLLVTSASGRSIVVRPISVNAVRLDLDLDGDGSVDFAARLEWNDLIDEQDLTDADDDGIYDAWEIANGLNPNDPADANLDPDLDTFTNLHEQLGGTDPNNQFSVPASANLQISIVPISAVVAGSNYDYRLDIDNLGPNPASNLLVTNPLAAGTSFVSASGIGWNCVNFRGSVYCTLDSLGLVTRSINITVTMPSTPGMINNEAWVSSVTVDTDSGNNSDSEVLNVM